MHVVVNFCDRHGLNLRRGVIWYLLCYRVSWHMELHRYVFAYEGTLCDVVQIKPLMVYPSPFVPGAAAVDRRICAALATTAGGFTAAAVFCV